jgi:hypothetical protein
MGQGEKKGGRGEKGRKGRVVKEDEEEGGGRREEEGRGFSCYMAADKNLLYILFMCQYIYKLVKRIEHPGRRATVLV